MSDKPRRAWFQIHLSTAIVLMFVAGGLLTLNLSPRKNLYITQTDLQSEAVLDYQVCAQIGWPLAVINGNLAGGFKKYNLVNVQQAEMMFRETPVPALREFFHSSDWPLFWSRDFSFFGLAINSILFVFVLITLASILEFLIRRPEARAP